MYQFSAGFPYKLAIFLLPADGGGRRVVAMVKQPYARSSC
jgi:hypothetical protein